MNDFNSSNSTLIEVLLKNKKIFIIVGFSAAVLSVVFSSSTFIKPRYQSQAIVYPSNLGEYSEESPIEQMMQWFESRSIKDKMIAEFNLAEHYNINIESDKLGMYYLLMEYDKYVQVNQTKYESAEILIQDTDPQKAYEMVLSIIKHYNETVREEHKKRALEDLLTAEKQFNGTKHDLDSVGQELKKIRKEYEIINYSSQSQEVTKGFLRTFDGASKTSVNDEDIKKLKINLEEKGGDFIVLENRMYQILEEYKKNEIDYKEALKVYNRDMTYTNLVSAPAVSHKKVYPVRWLIVVLSTFSSVFFALIFVMVQRKISK